MIKHEEVIIHNNEEHKIVFWEDMDNWVGRFKIYAQNVKGKMFVTFRSASYDLVHFNDSNSISVNEFYGKKDELLIMIDTAKKLGWGGKND